MLDVLTSKASSSLVFALDGCQADGLLALLLVIIAVRLQVAAAQASLVLLLPHPPLLGLSADRRTQTLFLFLQGETPEGINILKSDFYILHFYTDKVHNSCDKNTCTMYGASVQWCRKYYIMKEIIHDEVFCCVLNICSRYF